MVSAYVIHPLIFFSPVNCSDPTPPVDGSIGAYQNTTEGAVIFFTCNPMFVPTESMTAVCGEDRRWSPDPADHRCTCEYPSTVCLCIAMLSKTAVHIASLYLCINWNLKKSCTLSIPLYFTELDDLYVPHIFYIRSA